MSADIYKKIDKKEESGFWINAYLYLEMINDQLGNREKAVEYYEKLLEMREYLNSQELAKKYLSEPFKN